MNSPVDVTVNGKSAEVQSAIGVPGAVDGSRCGSLRLAIPGYRNRPGWMKKTAPNKAFAYTIDSGPDGKFWLI